MTSETSLIALQVISGIDKVGLTQADEEGVGTNSNKPLGIGAIFVNVIFFGIFAIMCAPSVSSSDFTSSISSNTAFFGHSTLVGKRAF